MNFQRDADGQTGVGFRLWTKRLCEFLCFFSATFILTAGPALAEGNTIIVKQQTVATQLETYAQVEPIMTLPVRAPATGVVTGMTILPGETSKSGQSLAKLGGSEIQALLLQRTAELKSAQTRLASAKKALVFQQQQRKLQLATKLTVFQAESALAQAQSAFDTAQAQLRALRQFTTLKAPADGIVLSIDAGNGERVVSGQPILTLQLADKLWLKAAYYGADASAIRDGMTGQFIPADGGDPIAVKVVTVFGAKASDGGVSVGIMASKPTPRWLNGEFGTVMLIGPERSMVAVPTRALVLDQGKWWVMVHTITGNHPQSVTPGPTRGWQTFIVHGLEPGTEVVVDNAYLEFHRSISQHYQPPD
jgi:RND family efflux transporter MFP subunit